jgi:hypothetical protein
MLRNLRIPPFQKQTLPHLDTGNQVHQGGLPGVGFRDRIACTRTQVSLKRRYGQHTYKVSRRTIFIVRSLSPRVETTVLCYGILLA